MRHIDLFSGIGGFALASSWVWGERYENVGHSEIEKYACKVYHRHFPNSRCLGDITKIEWQEGQADLITGGFPCQPHSVAGKRKGQEDERDLWGECVRAVRMVRPRYALFENVPGLFTSNGGCFFRRVLGDLAAIGYDAEWGVVSAASVGAPHLRERVWILCYPRDSHESHVTTLGGICEGEVAITGRSGGPLAYPNTGRCSPDLRETLPRREGETEPDPESCGRGERGQAVYVVNAEDERPQGGVLKACGCERDERGETWTEGRSPLGYAECERGCGGGNQREDAGDVDAPGETQRPEWNGEWWTTEPTLGDLVDGLPIELDVARRSEYIRVAKGIPKRADQLKGLGNAIVPQVAYEILKRISED